MIFLDTNVVSETGGDRLERIKIAANKHDVPYQSLIKTWLTEKADLG